MWYVPRLARPWRQKMTSKALSYTMTNETITVVVDGKARLCRKGAPNFVTLRQAILDENWDAVKERVEVKKAVNSWAGGKFKVEDGKVNYQGEELPEELTQRILTMAAKGEDPTRICRFWERLKLNPSKRSVDQLWKFLGQLGIPLTKDGTFLAYKGVNSNYKDVHSGTFNNRPGTRNKMDRNKISDDPNQACHEGFHVGALEYAKGFGARVVICEVDPKDVVCVPYDHNCRKMRVSEYYVTGNHNGQFMSDTSAEEAPDLSDVPPDPVEAGATDVKVPYRFKKIHALSAAELMEKSTEDLRDYAANGLKIVGASRIPGGKIALVQTIEKTREGK